jgi:cysteine sulfinate desulfinase/cysteine desulfurase-like protein
MDVSTATNIYLDANGGMPLSTSGLKAIERAGKCCNASNTNALAGREAEKEYLNSCEKIKSLLLTSTASPDWELVNTSGASEGLVTCLTSLNDSSFPILIANGAHPVVEATTTRYKLNIAKCQNTKAGVELAMEEGQYSGLLITHSISLTGELIDVAGMAKVFGRKQSGPIILDSTQTIGKLPGALSAFCGVSPSPRTCIDTVIFSSHKFGASKGHGGVLIRRAGPMMTLWKPLIPGSQQGGLRGGTINVMGTSSCADALEEALDGLDKKHETSRISVGHLIDEIKALDLPRIKLLAPLDTSPERNVMNTVLVALPFCSKAFAKELSENGYDVGTGTACQTHQPKVGLKIDGEQHPYQIRISLPAGFQLDAKAFMSTFKKIYDSTLARWKERLEKEMNEIGE